MKSVFLCLIMLSFASPVFSQTQLDACAVMQNPEKYANSVVVLKGVVHSSFEQFSMTAPDCDKIHFFKICLEYPGEVEAKDAPSLNSTDIKFVPGSASRKFDRLLTKRQKCGERRVSATLRGLFQYRKETLVHYPDGSSAIVGFGHQGMYRYRLVILSVESAESLPCTNGAAPR